MKQCPKCNNTYTDDSLKFCLTDGTPLDDISGSAETVAFTDADTMRMEAPERTAGERIKIPAQSSYESVKTVFPSTGPSERAKSGSNSLIIGLLVVLIIVILAGFGGIAAYFWMSPKAEVKTAETPSQSEVPTPNDTEELKRKLAELEKQIAEQKTAKPETKTQPKTVIENAGMTARANSPGDGFLALRSQPNTETGERLAKIPHGAAITVIGCPRPTNPGKMRGKWCRVIYDGIEGWAFDAYMKFD